MKTKWSMVVGLGCFVLLALWLTVRRADDHAAPALDGRVAGAVETVPGATGSADIKVVAEVASAPPAAASGGSGVRTSQEALAIVDAVLSRLAKRRTERVTATELPVLDAESEQVLIERYRIAGTIAEKEPLLRVLALAGGDATCDMLTNAILIEFKGYVAADGEHLVLRGLPAKMGILARRNDRALQFLLDAVRGNSVIRPGLWKDPSQDESSLAEVWLGSCYTALAITGRREAREVFDSLLSEPAGRVHPGYVSPLIMDAAYRMYLVDLHGPEKYFERPSVGHREFMDGYGRWLKSEDGLKWRAWYNAHTERE